MDTTHTNNGAETMTTAQKTVLSLMRNGKQLIRHGPYDAPSAYLYDNNDGLYQKRVSMRTVNALEALGRIIDDGERFPTTYTLPTDQK